MSSTPASDLGNPAPTKRVLWKWSAALTGLILIFLMWQCGSALVQGRKLSDAAVRHFHQQLNAGDYEGICREADQGFGGSQGHDESIRFLEAVHQKLGLAGPETRLNIRVETNPGGTFLAAQYSTKFAAGAATEMFTWVKSGGTLKLNGYHIQSNALILDEKKPIAQNPETVELANGNLHVEIPIRAVHQKPTGGWPSLGPAEVTTKMVAPRFVGSEAWAFRRPRSGDVSHPQLGFLKAHSPALVSKAGSA